MRPRGLILRSRYVGVCILVLMAMLVGTIGASADVPLGNEPPARGPAGIAPTVPLDPNVTTPLTFFGYNLGTEGMLTPWTSHVVPTQGLRQGVYDYTFELARTSNRVHTVDMGVTSEGRRMVYLVITSPENWAKIAQLKAINSKLADPRQVSSDAEARSLATIGKPVYWVSGNIHSTEYTSGEMLPRLAYDLAAFQDEWTQSVLDNLIVVVEPSSNPDGKDMVTDWYYRYNGTAYQNSSPPCYSEYVCHDNNRDFFGLNLVESQNIANARDEWKAAQHLDVHQSRTMLYMSPSLDPPFQGIDGLARAEWMAIGSNTLNKMVGLDWRGVYIYNYPDVFYPGYNESWSNTHNGLGSYWEAQGARNGAWPTTITSKGMDLAWYNPYPVIPGFSWTLAQSMNLEEDAVMQTLDYMAKNKTAMLYNFYQKGLRNLAEASGTAPYGYVIPQDSGDNADVTDMVNNLLANKFEVRRATAPFSMNGESYAAGDYVLRFDQPYGLTLKQYLATQTWPASAGTPYDVTAWTYQYMRDVAAVPISPTMPIFASTVVTGPVAYAGALTGDVSSWYLIQHEANNNLMRALPQIWAQAAMTVSQASGAIEIDDESYPAGTFFVQTAGTEAAHAWLKALVEHTGLKAQALASAVVGTLQMRQPRVALYNPIQSPTNEGWLRIVLNQSGFPYTRLMPSEVMTPTVPLTATYDVIILPSNSPSSLRSGSTSSSTPPDVKGGFGQQGVDNLKAFVQAGGILVLNGSASTFPLYFNWGVPGISQSTQSAELAKLAEGWLPEKLVPLAKEMSNDTDGVPDHGMRDVSAGNMAPTAVYAPGSLLGIKLDPSDPVAYGYDADAAIWDSSYPFFSVAITSTAKAVGWYPPDKDALLSGYLTGGDALRGKAAIVDAPFGSGRVVMFGTDVAYRAQPTGSYMFLFNSMLLGGRGRPVGR
jgi:hypothetical protein